MLVHTPEQPPQNSTNLLVCFMGEGKLLTHVDGARLSLLRHGLIFCTRCECS